MNELTVRDQEQFDGIIEDLSDIFIEFGKRGRLIANEMRLRLGESILSSPLYKKHDGELVEMIAKEIGKSEETIYLWIRFYENRKQFDDLEMPWHKVVKQLQGREEKAMVRKPTCSHCPIHCYGGL